MPPWMIGCWMPNISVIAVLTWKLRFLISGRFRTDPPRPCRHRCTWSPRDTSLCAAGPRSGDGRQIRQFRWAVQYPEQRAPPELPHHVPRPELLESRPEPDAYLSGTV